MSFHGFWEKRKGEVPIRLIIVIKNKNCQAYLCVFPAFPSFPLFRRFSIFSLPPFASSSSLSWPNMAYLIFNSTASFLPVSSFNGENAEPQRSERAKRRRETFLSFARWFAPLWLRTLPTEGALTGRNEAVLLKIR